MPLFRGYFPDKRARILRPSVHRFNNKHIQHNRTQANYILANVFQNVRKGVGRFPKFLVFSDISLKFAVYKKFQKIQRRVISNRCKTRRLSRDTVFKNSVLVGQYQKALSRMHKICKRKAFFYSNMLGPRLLKKDFFMKSKPIFA
jgi:hypothetical protein